MADEQSDGKFSRRDFLGAGTVAGAGALAGAGVGSVANMFARGPSSDSTAKPASDRSRSDPGPANPALDSQNPDSGSPPPTDAGGVQTF